MKLLIVFSVLLLAGITTAAPTKDGDDDIVTVTKALYPDSFVKYTSKHDIVSLFVPVNALNFDENASSSSEEEVDITFFFVEADVSPDGKRTYQGLYVYKDGKAKKILDNGRDATASSDDSKQVFFAATDGIYEYKSDTNEAVKYGSITDSIIGIAKTTNTDVIYILTEDHELYKVTEAGTVKTKVDEVVNAQEIVLDYSNNLYFYGEDKKPYVLTATGLKSIEGLPTNPTYAKLLRPPFIIEDGVPFIVNNASYKIYANGLSESYKFEFKRDAVPTAYSMEGTLIQYYALDKKIYEFNIMLVASGQITGEVKSIFGEKASTIQSLASQKRINRIKA